MTSQNVETYPRRSRGLQPAVAEKLWPDITPDSVAWTDHPQAPKRPNASEESQTGSCSHLDQVLLQDIQITRRLVPGHRRDDRPDLPRHRRAARARLGPYPATGERFGLPLYEMWQLNSDGHVVGGGLY